MDVYVARQPIFGHKMNVYGYELLYRRSMNNFYEGLNDNQATAETINNAFFVMNLNELTSGTRAFINFPEELLEMEIPFLLPKELIVVEILETIKITEKVINLCKKLKSEGYMLALDDFVFNEDYIPLIEIADIIKVEFSIVDLKEQQRLIKKYKGKVEFLAEKIETREQYKLAVKMGYDYFQGYFFSKPVIIKGKGIAALNINFIKIIKELNRRDFDYQKITEIVERDLGISYQILRISNSVALGSKYKIYTIKQALVRMGASEIMRWVYLMMLKDIQILENKELIKSSLVRGKLMELLAVELDMKKRHMEFFMTGLFSQMNILLNRTMKQIVKDLPLTRDVKKALLGHKNEIRKVLNRVIQYERVNWSEIKEEELFLDIEQERYMRAYIEALKWVMELDY